MPYLVHTVWSHGDEDYEHVITETQKNALVKRKRNAGGKVVEVLLVKNRVPWLSKHKHGMFDWHEHSTPTPKVIQKFSKTVAKALQGDIEAQAELRALSRNGDLAETLYAARVPSTR